MAAFHIQEKISEGLISYEISGAVDEHADFPPSPFSPTVLISFGEITAFNSIGIRSWCQWIGRMKPPTLIRVDRAPVLLVKCFNQVKGSKPANMQVMSFLVPFYSETSGERKDLLIGRESYSPETGKVDLPEVRDSQGEIMELDVFDNYFQFLKS